MLRDTIPELIQSSTRASPETQRMGRAGNSTLLAKARSGSAVAAAPILMLILAPACAPAGGGSGIANENEAAEANGNGSAPPDDLPPIRNSLTDAVNDWTYVLQGDPLLDLDVIGQSPFDLVVIDYSEDGGKEGEFAPEDIDRLRAGAGDAKIVLAYMSIGEAEVGRFYFDNAWVSPDPDQDSDGPFELTDHAPDFLAPPNPLFPDNFKVRYWDPHWQEIIVSNLGGNAYIGDETSYLERIVDAGFDGVYLDIIDAFEYFGPGEINDDGPEERRDAAALMIELVVTIKEHAEQYGGREFLVFPQNGSGLISEASFPQRYFDAVDGIGAEDTFYFGDEEEENPLDPQTDVIALLDRYRSAGLLVLAIDYLTEAATMDDFYARARDRGWVPYSSIRDLSVLTVNQTQPPD
jgi:cysteinyl-tRNA synthetase